VRRSRSAQACAVVAPARAGGTGLAGFPCRPTGVCQNGGGSLRHGSSLAGALSAAGVVARVALWTVTVAHRTDAATSVAFSSNTVRFSVVGALTQGAGDRYPGTLVQRYVYLRETCP
jgi:hypothetical protein